MADQYSYTRAEQETTITFDAEEKTAHIYSADPVYIRKLDKLTGSNPESYRCVRVLDGGKAKMYEAPAALIRFAKPPTEARREAGRRNTRGFSFSSSNISVKTNANEPDE